MTDKKEKQNDTQRTKQECSSPSLDHPFAFTHLLSLPTHRFNKHLAIK